MFQRRLFIKKTSNLITEVLHESDRGLYKNFFNLINFRLANSFQNLGSPFLKKMDSAKNMIIYPSSTKQ